MRTSTTLLAAFATAVIALAGCGGGNDNKDNTAASTIPAQPKRAAPSSASRDDLTALANSVGHDVFWAGSKRGYTYELSRTKDNNIYIRYLPPGVPIGAAGADFLSVGTYPQKDAFATVKAAQKQEGESTTKLRNGGLAVSSPNRPQSVYFAYPGSKLLVEVYDPDPARALRLIRRNQVVPVR